MNQKNTVFYYIGIAEYLVVTALYLSLRRLGESWRRLRDLLAARWRCWLGTCRKSQITIGRRVDQVGPGGAVLRRFQGFRFSCPTCGRFNQYFREIPPKIKSSVEKSPSFRR